jgi:hypothetical protein
MRKKNIATDDRQDAGLDEATIDQPTNVFDKAQVQVLPDGRVEAAIRDNQEKPVNELIGRTSQANAAKFIFNDLCPAALEAAGTGKPFGQE